jgi:predicted RNA-binding protein YlxR (DUF448 family)
VELVRIARTLDGELVVSRHAPGRGGWLCAGSPDCLASAIRRKAFDRAFRASVPAEATAALAEELFGNDRQNLRDLSVPGRSPGDGTRPKG